MKRNERKRTTEQFITEAKEIYKKNGKGPFDFSKTEYKGCTDKTIIICPKHGEFLVTPHKVLSRGDGCPKCADEERADKKRWNTEKFIKKAKEIHGNKYDYSKSKYTNCKEKICIICPKHGEFWQIADSHIRGKGCSKCADETRNDNTRLTQEEFVKRAKEKYGNKFSYQNTKFHDLFKKVYITCPIHGDFFITPSHFLGDSKHGCPKCGRENIAKLLLKSNEQFIKDSIKAHGNKYDYSKTEYKGDDKKVCIICPKHGEFWQLAGSHIAGAGCPKCSESRGEEEVRLYLENHNIEFETQKKFKDCKDKKCLPFDFYLPKENILIEYDGSQHYKPSEYFGGQKAFETIQKHDKIKNEYCKNNNINLIRIKYNQDINTVLKESLS